MSDGTNEKAAASIEIDTFLYGLVLVATMLMGFAEVIYDNSANTFVGPPVGALLLIVAFSVPFFVDAATFASRDHTLRMPFFVAGLLNVTLFFFAAPKLTTEKIEAARAGSRRAATQQSLAVIDPTAPRRRTLCVHVLNAIAAPGHLPLCRVLRDLRSWLLRMLRY